MADEDACLGYLRSTNRMGFGALASRGCQSVYSSGAETEMFSLLIFLHSQLQRLIFQTDFNSILSPILYLLDIN